MTFRFKSFAVDDDRSTMKVGTDAVLLGAWSSHRRPRQILDVGTGCGVIALLLAQRYPDAVVHAIEPDGPSAVQAGENAAKSAWSDRLTCVPQTVQEFTADTNAASRYDLIVCNPPFFDSGPMSPSAPRRQARHTTELPWTDLCAAGCRLMTAEGQLCVVLPATGQSAFDQIATDSGLHLTRRCDVRGMPDKPVRRTLLQYGTQPGGPPIIDQLTIEERRHQYTPRYAALMGDFLLRTPDTRSSHRRPTERLTISAPIASQNTRPTAPTDCPRP